MTVTQLLGLIFGYFAYKTMRWLLEQEHRGKHIDVHINFYGECDYIVYDGMRYYPELKGVLKRGG